MSEPRFVHLRVHSDYSMIDGLAKTGPLVKKAAALGMPALAITDFTNLCGLVKFYGTGHGAGIKPIVGADFHVRGTPLGDELCQLTVLAANNTGYQNLTLLISKAYQRGYGAEGPVIDREWLTELKDGLILLSGGRMGDVGRSLLRGNSALVDECVAFYEEYFSDRYYLELIRKIHIRTYAYLGEMKASTNPLAYCEGGFYGGHLGLHDKIKPLLKTATASFGITAFNELQELYNGKSLVEDGQFALEVLRHINDKVNEFKKADGNLYAIYATPAENLCGLQVKQFRKKYGIVENVSDREYVSNGFHCHVTEDITPIEKQDLEYRFWELSNGGKIQYVKYPIDYNKEAIKSLVRRAMKMGFYEGVNLSLSYCDNCGHEELNMDVCPVCGSKNLTKIDRMNGYLSYSRVKGDTRLNDAKMAEIAERKSM